MANNRLQKFSDIYLNKKQKISESSWAFTGKPTDEQFTDPIEKAKFLVAEIQDGTYSKEELEEIVQEIVMDNSLWYAKNPKKESSSFTDALYKATGGLVSDENRDVLIQALSKEFVKWNKMTGVIEARVTESAIGVQNFFHSIGQDSVKFATFANDNGLTTGKLGNIFFSDFDDTLTLYFKEKGKAEEIIKKISDIAQEHGCKTEIVNGSIEVHNIKNFENVAELAESKLSYSVASKSSTRDKILAFIGGGENFRRKNYEYLTYINSIQENQNSGKKINKNYVNMNSHLFRKFDIGKESYIGLTKIGKKIFDHISENENNAGKEDSKINPTRSQEDLNKDIIAGLNIVLSKIVGKNKFEFKNGLFEAHIEKLGKMTIDEISEELSELSETFGGLLNLEEITTDPDIIKIKFTK